MREVKINNEEEARRFGHELAEKLTPNTVLALIGDLGTGKTALTPVYSRRAGRPGTSRQSNVYHCLRISLRKTSAVPF